ncbi:hypothetical protein CLU79DRAFT_834061 [Phycomyces nitens]|nr:hypothetical protein CLU79DRAFT_834061 [Phycomyces nitens]
MDKNISKRSLPATRLSEPPKKVPTKYLDLIRQSREQDGKMETLKRAIRYKEQSTLEEMNTLIAQWRSIAQQVIVEIQCAFNENPIFFEEQDNEDSQEKPLKNLLKNLHIDPVLVRYSEETDELLIE